MHPSYSGGSGSSGTTSQHQQQQRGRWVIAPTYDPLAMLE